MHYTKKGVNAKFKVDGNVATKTLIGYGWNKPEFTLAKQISEASDIYTKVYDYINPSSYTHEWLGKVTPLHDYMLKGMATMEADWCDEAFYVLHKALNVCMTHRNCVVEMNKQFPLFFHSDFTTYNIVVTKDLDVKVIDMDSFRISRFYQTAGCAIDRRHNDTINTIIHWQKTIAQYRKVANI